MPGVLVPGLVPGDERGPFPALVVVVGEDRVPVGQVRDPPMVAPSPPLVGQIEREVDLRRDGLAGRDGPFQGDDHHGVLAGVERERRGAALDADGGDGQPSARQVQRLLGAEPEDLQRLGQDRPIGLGHPVAGIDVEDQLGDGDRRAVREGHPLPGRDPPRIEIQPQDQIIPRQALGDRDPFGRRRHFLGAGDHRPRQTEHHDQPDDRSTTRSHRSAGDSSPGQAPRGRPSSPIPTEGCRTAYPSGFRQPCHPTPAAARATRRSIGRLRGDARCFLISSCLSSLRGVPLPHE
jgi:hypothetical protein